jgi:hypothetical protein
MLKTIMGTLAMLAPALALAQASLHRIETIPANPEPGKAVQLRVSGDWPNTCTPSPLPVVVDGVNIDLAVRQLDAICGEAITPYSLTFDLGPALNGGTLAAGNYRVRFAVKDSALQPTLLAFRVVEVAFESARGVQPEPGFWAPDLAGEFLTPNGGIGMMIERQGSTLAMTTNAYAPGGQPAWYLSAGALANSTFRADLLQSVGGQPLWMTSRGPQSVLPAGTIEVEFNSDSSAVVWFARASGEGILDALDLMPISMRRMNFALASDGQLLEGAWLLSATERGSSLPTALIRLAYRGDLSTASEAVLVDTGLGYEMRCMIDPMRRDGPPTSCRLISRGAEIARFDNNALSRLSGRRDGVETLLLRVGD